MHAFPTLYAQTWFRSRLEARWARVFDGLGLTWDYEPEGYVLPDNLTSLAYLPDFWLPQVRFYAEVKPNDDPSRLVLTDEAIAKGRALVNASNRPLLFLDGRPRLTNYWAMMPLEMDAPWWCDVDLFQERAYHLTERRFYMSTGLTSEDLVHAALTDNTMYGARTINIIAEANGNIWMAR